MTASKKISLLLNSFDTESSKNGNSWHYKIILGKFDKSGASKNDVKLPNGCNFAVNVDKHKTCIYY